MAVACGAHALHDGYTDLIYVMLPIWQSEFGLGFAALGLLRTVFSGTLAGFQMPSGLLAERLGAPLVLALGTALAGLGYVLGGLQRRRRHSGGGAVRRRPRRPHAASARLVAGRAGLRRRALAQGARHLQFRRRHRQDDACRRAASLLLLVLPWRPALIAASAVLGVSRRRRDLLALMPRLLRGRAGRREDRRAAATRRRRPHALGFPLLLSIGMIDSATRMAFLTFLPFVLTAKGASLPTVGLALTLVFAGGAAGKLVCAFIGARIGAVATVWLTEGLTAAGILALLPLPLEAALLSAAGDRRRAQRHLVGAVRLGAGTGRRRSKRTRAFGIFYTGTIGAGAVSPALYGLLGDAVGVPTALIVVAAIVLLTLPLT